MRPRLLLVLATFFLALAACTVEGGPERAPGVMSAAEPGPSSPEGGPFPDRTVAAASGGTLIQGGMVVDGTGAPGRRSDVLLRDGRIAHIGPMDADTMTLDDLIEASGLVLTPGFIDPHAHGDPLSTPAFPSFLAMGVTTIVLGQDGSSPGAGELAAVMRSVAAARPAVNVAWFVGHNTIRGESGVGFGAPGEAGLARMGALVDQAMEAGAFGLSLGLEYTPGSAASIEELAAIARPVAVRDGVVMSHLRNEDHDQVEASLEELLEQGRRSGARVHASHLKVVLGSDPSQALRMLETLARAREEGLGATADLYPYTASFTGLSILFPDWARPPNSYESAVGNRRAELAAHLRQRVEARNGPEATLFGSGAFSGRTLAEVARDTGRPFEDILMELGPDGARAAYFVMDEEVMRVFVMDRHVAIASDGSPTMSHPRGFGSFPRVIRQFVREEGLLELEEAVRKMTGLTASILGMDDPTRVEVPRGRIAEGWAADVLLFDPAQVRDLADYEVPHRTAEGIRDVWVNGERTVRDGVPVREARSGQVLRRGAAVDR